MKKTKLLAILLAVVLVLGVCLSACNISSYEITLNPNKSFTIEVGDTIDFTQYFVVTHSSGIHIAVTESMLDLSQVDVSKPGAFDVTLTVGGVSKTATFTVVAKGSGPSGGSDDLSTALNKYADVSAWNFAVDYKSVEDGEVYEEYYEYLGYNVLNSYDIDGYGFIDYLGYNQSTDTYYFYYDNGDGTYDVFAEGTEDFEESYFYLYLIDLSALADFDFVADGNKYVATNPNAAGNAVIAEYEDYEWVSLAVYISNGEIVKVVGEMDDGYTETYTLSKHGQISFTLPSALPGGGAGGSTGDNTGGGNTGAVTTNTSVFKDKNLTVDAGCVEYTANVAANDFESNQNERGVQFLNTASVVLTSKTSVSGVTTVEVTCSTNKDAGITVTVTVGGTQLTSSKNTVAKGTANANTVLQFTSGSPLSGVVVVTITGAATKSAYVKSIAINGGSGSSGGGTSNVMNKQTYNSATFDNENLQDKLLDYEGAIGLPSIGDVNALVVPVQFVGDTITSTQLSNLNKAFNGDGSGTGWESVHSYYYTSSYGKLNLTFDIQNVYQAKNNASYYESYSEKYLQDGHQYTRTGEEIILTEVLAYYESRLDLTKYDNNNDGCIDAVYLIYSADVDYGDADFYWAYVTWYYGENKYDGLDAYYYLFAGFDFMDESTSRDPGSGYDRILGLTINAATYIHETGHLLGLDDYYDYDERKGSNEGLGSADMMDYTVGDHNVYSKIMLGWLTPTIVNETTTLTIKSSEANASAILIPLNFNNSYFCEYLLIDLYSAEGLNALHASTNNSFLYDGAAYGVRIYHVSSSINDPFKDDGYGSFTDCNNSVTAKPLIKLVEADGERKFASTNGWAAESDLWLAGGQLSKAFPNYTRNDGKLLNFDVKINSVSATSASITVTFAD